MAKETKRRSTRTKSSSKKAPVKRTRRSKKKSTFKKDLSIFASVILMVGMVVLGYQIGKSEGVEVSDQSPNQMLYKSVSDNKDLYQGLEKVRDERARKEQALREKKAREQKRIEQEKLALAKKIEEEKKKEQQLLEKKQEATTYPANIVRYDEAVTYAGGQRPKLAIIIDDVSSKTQLHALQSLGMKLTPSIFPPYSLSPSNHKLASKLKHFMVHLPMQSGKNFDKQEKTLMVTDTPDQIEKRVREIRRLFPHARYVNNHTGSVFTSNYLSMERLYRALKKEGFVFVDSRTTASTTVPKITKKYDDPYFARDVFIDNQHTVAAIHKQLKHAVNLAKKRGYAIAIGHPHKVTIEALASADEILKGVEIVYIDELYHLKGKK